MIETLEDLTSFRWATVTQLSPLRIKLDGDTAALLLTPESLVDEATLIVNDRVRVELTQRKVVIHGRNTGTTLLTGTSTRQGILELATPAEALAVSDTARATTPQSLAWSTSVVRCVPTSMAVGSGSGSYDSFGKVTFAGASSISLNGIFTADFLNYIVLINLTSTSGGAGFLFRFGVTTTDDTTGYLNTYAEHPGAGAWSFPTSLTDAIRIGRCSSNGAAIRATVFSPFLAGSRTWAEGISQDSDNYQGLGTGVYNTAKSHNRLTMIPSGVNATGTLEVYGVRG